MGGDGPGWRPQKDSSALLGVELFLRRLCAYYHSGEVESLLALELQAAVGADPLGSSVRSLIGIPYMVSLWKACWIGGFR